MVISSTLTYQHDIVRAPVPLSRTRPRSVPVYISRSPSTSPNTSRLSQKRRSHRKRFIEEKPPFINFASAHINPYRPLSPIPPHPIPPSRCSRSKSRSSKRKQRQQTASIDISRTKETLNSSSSKSLSFHPNPSQISAADPNAFRREFCRKRQLIVDHSYYRVNVDSWKVTTLNHLTQLIGELIPDNDDALERLWIIYYWITQNIRYDLDADTTYQNRQQKAEDVFRAGKSSCHGYAVVFKGLCDSLKISCEMIEGYAKDFNFKIDQTTFSRTNHTWNAVQIDQRWYLLDSAWGTGYIDANHEYKKDLKSYYFLTSPTCMIYNHLPEEARWQLLRETISMNDYLRLPHLHSYYFTYGLNIVSSYFSNCLTFDPNRSVAEVFIDAPEDVQLTCSVKNDLRSSALAHYDVNRQLWHCLFTPHKSGFHTLIVYATRLTKSNVFKNVIEFGIDVPANDLIQRKTLPFIFEKFLEYKCQIFSPLTGIVKHGTKIHLRCRIPHASSVRISLDGIWSDEITMKNDLFKQEINVPEREILVYARFRHEKSKKIYDGLIRYLVEK